MPPPPIDPNRPPVIPDNPLTGPDGPDKKPPPAKPGEVGKDGKGNEGKPAEAKGGNPDPTANFFNSQELARQIESFLGTGRILTPDSSLMPETPTHLQQPDPNQTGAEAKAQAQAGQVDEPPPPPAPVVENTPAPADEREAQQEARQERKDGFKLLDRRLQLQQEFTYLMDRGRTSSPDPRRTAPNQQGEAGKPANQPAQARNKDGRGEELKDLERKGAQARLAPTKADAKDLASGGKQRKGVQTPPKAEGEEVKPKLAKKSGPKGEKAPGKKAVASDAKAKAGEKGEEVAKKDKADKPKEKQAVRGEVDTKSPEGQKAVAVGAGQQQKGIKELKEEERKRIDELRVACHDETGNLSNGAKALEYRGLRGEQWGNVFNGRNGQRVGTVQYFGNGGKEDNDAQVSSVDVNSANQSTTVVPAGVGGQGHAVDRTAPPKLFGAVREGDAQQIQTSEDYRRRFGPDQGAPAEYGLITNLFKTKAFMGRASWYQAGDIQNRPA